jgi:hypothetical protein
LKQNGKFRDKKEKEKFKMLFSNIEHLNECLFPYFNTSFGVIVEKFRLEENMNVFSEQLGMTSFKNLKKDLEVNGKHSSKILEKTFTFLGQNFIVNLLLFKLLLTTSHHLSKL